MRRLLLVIVAVLLGLLGTPSAGAAPTIDRQAGSSRYETASEVAHLLHPTGAARAVVASGTSWPDALTAGVAASALGAPLLLASSAVVPVDAIRTLGVRDVLLIGGTAALPAAVASQLVAAGASVERIAGADRYATARAVTERVQPVAASSIEVAGTSFPSALVAAANAARTGAALVLRPDLRADEVRTDGHRFVGTPGAINLSLLRLTPPSRDIAVVTTISSFPDALSASALASAYDAAVLFTETSSATESAIDTMDVVDPVSVIVVGGPAAVSERVLQQLFGFAPLPPTVPAGAEDSIATDVFARINAERAGRGIPPLLWDAALAADARSWAQEMSRTGYRHGVLPAAVGENIHMPIGTCTVVQGENVCVLPTSGRVHLDWMRSDGNRDNVLEVGYIIGGVGVYCGPDGTLWAVARFGIGFGGITHGGTAPDPVVRGDAGGVDCSGRHT